MKEKVTRSDCCQYLPVSRTNRTLTDSAEHCGRFSHDAVNRYLAGDNMKPENESHAYPD